MMVGMQVTVLVFLTTIYLSVAQRVNTTMGEIVGQQITLDIDGNKYNVSEYLGIPYAQPPTGELRFSKPQKIGSVGTFSATSFSASCPQLSSGLLPGNFSYQSEDCLTLNVFVPNRTADEPYTGHAVFVWFHGGAFVEGSSDIYNGTFLATYGNVIVVTVNYRLNVFGFISTDDDSARGNFGLWDQRMALQWIQENIEYFGGDKDRVTIGGFSAGAKSCTFQGLVPDNDGLFQRIIAESGGLTTPRLPVTRHGLQDAQYLAKEVGCPTLSTKDLITCLRSRSWEEILLAVKNAGISSNRFTPIIDGRLIKRDPHVLVRMSDNVKVPDEINFFRSLDVLSGFNSYEGAFRWLIAMEPGQIEHFLPTKDDTERVLRGLVESTFNREFSEEVLAMTRAEYTNWTNPKNSDEIRLKLTKVMGDILYGVPSIEITRLHKTSLETTSKHYMYLFTPNSTVDFLYAPSWIPGANHADEVLFVFGIERHLPDTEPKSSWQIQLSRKMITFWTNFAKTGYPNSPESVTPYWPEYNMESQQYIKLEEQTTNDSIHQYLNARETNFWTDIFPDINKVADMKKSPPRCENSAASVNSVFGSIFLALFLFYVLAF